jgi:NAD-dependent deacetylase
VAEMLGGEPLGIPSDAHVVVMTGAGISAESGHQTFRGSGGLWCDYRIEDVATPSGFARDPKAVWRFYSERRVTAMECEPNAGHHAIVELEKRIRGGGGRFTLITQNVDGLHQRAGSTDVIAIHGNLMETRCNRSGCPGALAPVFDDEPHDKELPRCSECGELLRPAVVWFEEMLDPEHLQIAAETIADCGWFIAVGSSGTVWPVAGFAQHARMNGARTVLANLEPPENLFMFDTFAQGPASTVLPVLLR